MPNKKSAIKRVRTSERNRLYNRFWKSRCKTALKKVLTIVEKGEAVNELNELLHRCRKSIIGRLGIPYRQKGVSIICIAMDAPNDEINSLTGALGRLDGITAKATYSKV